jgi:phage gp46-like protein
VTTSFGFTVQPAGSATYIPVSDALARSSTQVRMVIDPATREGNLYRDTDGGILLDDGLETIVMVSLFTDARATVDDGLKAGEDLGGWWFDVYSETPGENTGSKLWTLYNSTLSDETVNKVQTYADEALVWMVEEQAATSVSTVATRTEDGVSCVTTITRPGDTSPYTLNWEAFFAVQ